MSASPPPIDTADKQRVESSRRSAIGFWIAQALVVIPVAVAALRDGHNGWYPTLDAGMTVLRAKDVFSANPPLIGMWTSVSTKLGIATYFPGATELYLLSVPIKFFGESWGPLIGMAVINGTWLVLAGWLLRRRLGDIGAIWGLLAFGLLVWTMGSETLIDVAPMQMVTIPFALFLVAVWSVADLDLDAIWLYALLANFLVLNHLVLTLLVPVIGLVAPIVLLVRFRSIRQDDPDRWAYLRKKLRFQVIIAVCLTVVLWLPTLIQQFTNSPGNLTNLYNASQVELHRSVGLGEAFSIVATMLAVPPFWFRNTFDTPLTSTPSGIATVIIWLLVVGLLGWLGFRAAQNKDRTTMLLLIIAGVAVLAAVLNIVNAPTNYGFRRQYFRSLWGTAMLFWLAVTIGVVRTWPKHRSLPATLVRRSTGVGLSALLIVTAFAIPHKNPGPGTNGSGDASIALSKKVLNRSIVMLRDKGQVQVRAAGDFSAFALMSTLVLYLEHYGVDVCVPKDLVAQYGKQRACHKSGPDVIASISSAAFPPNIGERTIVEATLLSEKEQLEKMRLAKKVADWLATQTELKPSQRVQRTLVNAYGEKGTYLYLMRTFNTNGLPLPAVMYSPDFIGFMVKRSFWRSDGSADAAIETGALPPEDIVRWAQFMWREYRGESVRISLVEPSPTDR